MRYEKYLNLLNFTKFSPIQEETFKHFNNKNNFIGVAPTGTGKTHAYLIPLVDSINLEENFLQGIIIVPTNELIDQVHDMIKPLINENFRVKTYDSNTNRSREINWLTKNQPHIVISTPEKINDFSNNGLNIYNTKYFILDEADMMFDEYYLKQIDDLINRVKNAKYYLFSATINNHMHGFIKSYFGVYDLVDTTNLHELNIEHRIIRTTFEEREDILFKVVDSLNPYLAIIFVSRKDDQIKLFNKLKERNLNVTMISGDLTKQQRRNILNDIHNLKYQYVVASDLASRGIDFDASHIINYDLPYSLEFFKHRSGRTGRMDKSGIVITITNNEERHKITRLEEMGFNFKEYRISKDGLVPKTIREANKISQRELDEIKKIPKPKKVKPNYKKKNKKKIKEAIRGKRNVKNR